MSGPKVVLITGCSAGGIGYHLSKEFAKRGHTVYATARNVKKITGLPTGIHTLELDVLEDAAVQRVVTQVLAEQGRIDVLVNNAGVGCVGSLLDLPLETVKANFETNTFATLRMVKAVVPHMAARKSGLVVNTGSILGNTPVPFDGAYCASKSAVHSLTDTLDMELRPLGVKVMLLTPGAVGSHFETAQTAALQPLPENSLYTSYRDTITAMTIVNQHEKNNVPVDVFARKVVSRVVSRNPPRTLILGGATGIMSFLRWLPRSWVLAILWSYFSKIGRKK